MIDRDTVIQLAISVGYPGVNEYGAAPDFVAALPSLMAVAQKAIESQKQTRRETEAMAECMDMVRQDLITAGVIGKSVPPMMLAEAVIAAQRKAVLAEREACASVASDPYFGNPGEVGSEVAQAIRNRGIGGGE